MGAKAAAGGIGDQSLPPTIGASTGTQCSLRATIAPSLHILRIGLYPGERGSGLTVPTPAAERQASLGAAAPCGQSFESDSESDSRFSDVSGSRAVSSESSAIPNEPALSQSLYSEVSRSIRLGSERRECCLCSACVGSSDRRLNPRVRGESHPPRLRGDAKPSSRSSSSTSCHWVCSTDPDLDRCGVGPRASMACFSASSSSTRMSCSSTVR
mmetsp:Transcript_58354/g.136970  ORF Transcript_58354/g.136970 Transcript_58354/m.136970 type:complete len:213 (+) Transcript_58354:1903-2541(+)